MYFSIRGTGAFFCQDEELPALVAREKTTPIPPPRVQGTAFRRVVNNKGKKALMNQEMGQLTAVLNTASFQQDPFAAVQVRRIQTRLFLK